MVPPGAVLTASNAGHENTFCGATRACIAYTQITRVETPDEHSFAAWGCALGLPALSARKRSERSRRKKAARLSANSHKTGRHPEHEPFSFRDAYSGDRNERKRKQQ